MESLTSGDMMERNAIEEAGVLLRRCYCLVLEHDSLTKAIDEWLIANDPKTPWEKKMTEKKESGRKLLGARDET